MDTPDNPNGKSAHVADSQLRRACVEFSIDQQKRCITREMMESHLGPATETTTYLQHNGIYYLVWYAPRATRPEFNFAKGYYENGQIGGCIARVFVGRVALVGSTSGH